jgi:acetyl esterase/lipase
MPIAVHWRRGKSNSTQIKKGALTNLLHGRKSAGGTLAVLVMQHIRASKVKHDIAGLVINYGCFDLSFLPSARMLDEYNPLVLSYEDAEQFTRAYLPTHSVDGRRHPKVSPLYADMRGLGSAIFIVGTVDGLLDDSLLASAKWAIAGNEAVLKFVPGAAHGFMTFDGTKVAITKQGWNLMIEYVNSKCK